MTFDINILYVILGVLFIGIPLIVIAEVFYLWLISKLMDLLDL